MNPEEARQERNRYTIFILTLSFSACALALLLENVILGWETWAIPFLIVSIFFAWYIHLAQPFTDRGRIYALATVYYAATFYQGVHESSMFDVSLIICFVFFLFSLADVLNVYDIGIAVYFLTLLYQIIVNYRLSVFTDPLVFSRMLLHILIVILTVRFSKSTINGRQRSAEMQSRVIGQFTEIHKRTEDFLANISHELRTPINAVTGLSSLLVEQEENPGEELTSIYMAGHRLSEQVSDILDYTEIDTNRVLISSDVYGIYSVVNDVISRFRMEEDFSVDLVVDVDPAVPSKLKGDARRLKKMLWHLIDNAFKFTREGGVYVRIISETRPYGINLAIEVSDTGMGIPQSELGRISRGYYQSNSGRSRSAGGMGLGLSIVYGFAHAMDGFVRVDSTPGQGTTVRVTVPQTVVDPEPCMSVADPEKLSIACYLRPERFRVPLMRDYYEAMITHLVRGLHVSLRRAGSLNDLKKMTEQSLPTHIFVAADEYDEDPAYFTSLSKTVDVIVIADHSFTPAEGGSITVLRKPFYGFPVAGILNALNVGGDIDPMRAEVAVSFPGLRVLVVDDEEMNLVVANGIFSGYGMKVITALSGREGLSIYEREDFDVVFMDHMMPEMDGVEAMKLMRQSARVKNRNTRFVSLTANAVSGAREMFLAEGFDGFLPKPLETSEMEYVLRQILPASKVQYEMSDNSNQNSVVTRTPEGAALGIERSLGDEALYRRLRRIFIREMPHNLRVFKSAYATGTLGPYSTRLRSLRDGAKIIGEEGLSRQARRLEMAIADQDTVRIQREHMELCSLYETCVQRLKKMDEQEGGDA